MNNQNDERVLFKKNPANYDPDMPPLEILKKYESGEYDKEDLLSHMCASAVMSDKKLEVIAKKRAREQMARERAKAHHIS